MKIRRWIAVATLVMVLLAGGASAQDAYFIRGDVNDDGRIDIADAISILGSLFGSAEDPARETVGKCRDAADANDDGKLDIADAIKILAHLFALAGALPEPSSTCGRDSTQDDLGCNVSVACTLAWKTIGEGGGTLNIDAPENPLHGLAIDVPEGALSIPAIIAASDATLPAPLPPLVTSFSTILELNSTVASFALPVRVTLRYKDSDLREDQFICVMFYDSSEQEWHFAETLNVDRVANSVTFQTDHFTAFASVSYNVSWKKSVVLDWDFCTDTLIKNPGEGLCRGIATFSSYYWIYRKGNNAFPLQCRFPLTLRERIARKAASSWDSPWTWWFWQSQSRDWKQKDEDVADKLRTNLDTGEPQHLGVKDQWGGLHAVLVVGWKPADDCSDSNFHGHFIVADSDSDPFEPCTIEYRKVTNEAGDLLQLQCGSHHFDLFKYIPLAISWNNSPYQEMDSHFEAALLEMQEFYGSWDPDSDKHMPTWSSKCKQIDGTAHETADCDCDDEDPAIYYRAPECTDGAADGKDNDCDGQTDEDCVGQDITITLPGDVALEMVWCPPGTFLMGRYAGEQYSSGQEDWQHQVTLTKGFYMGKYELTKRQWQAVMGTTPWAEQSFVLNDPDSPAVYVHSNDAQAFIAALNGLGQGTFSLPTEAQWEYACRAGTTTRFYWGDDLDCTAIGSYAWYYINASGVREQYAHVVGQKFPNEWGLYDMSGNVYECCQDWYDYPYSASPVTDPTGPPTGSAHVYRGGAFGNDPEYVRSAHRCEVDVSGVRFAFQGFRIARISPP